MASQPVQSPDPAAREVPGAHGGWRAFCARCLGLAVSARGGLVALLVAGYMLRSLSADLGLPYEWQWDEPEIMQKSIQVIRDSDYGLLRSGRIGYGQLNTLLHAGWAGISFLRGVEMGFFPNGIWGLEGERQTSYYWTVSSPYLWRQARILSAILGCVAIAFVFAAARLLGGTW